jgi:hypothetical protein
MEIKKANTFEENYIKEQISKIFVDGFEKHLQYFSKDTERLTKVFAHMFEVELFYVAVIENEIAGITACTNGIQYCINHNKKELIKHLGIMRGILAYIIFKREFKKLAIEIGGKIGSIEFVATLSKYYRKGVAGGIITEIIKQTEYDEYILEVADTNYMKKWNLKG